MGALIKIRSMAEMAEMAEDMEAAAGNHLGERRPLEADGRDAMLDADAVATTGRMLLKFVIGCLLEINSDHGKRALKVFKDKGAPVGTRRALQPTSWVFKLTRDVRVDCREFVRLASARGERCALTVQTLVRGHWKNQAYGPGSTLRKFIHIEPFWRGPEDAPIAVRSHVLGEGPRADS